MTLPQKASSLGLMGVLINSDIGPRNNRTTSGERTAYTLVVLDVDTCGMTWIVLYAISTPVRKVNMFSVLLTLGIIVSIKYVYVVINKALFFSLFEEMMNNEQFFVLREFFLCYPE